MHAVAVAMNDEMAGDNDHGGERQGRDFLDRLTPRVMRAYRKLEDSLPSRDDEGPADELAAVVEDILSMEEPERSLFVPKGGGVENRIRKAMELWTDRAVELPLAANSAPSRRHRP